MYKMNENELKKELEKVIKDHYKIHNDDVLPIVSAMTEFIGTVNSELRDNLIYSVFSRWIIKGVISSGDCESLFDLLLNEQHLFYGIGEEESDSVFTRSFSSLIIAVLLYRDRTISTFLDEHILKKALSQYIYYINLEKDLRGYVAVKGWAHSIAHAADVLDEFVRYEFVGKEDLEEVLQAISEIILQPNYLFQHEEDERLATVVIAIVERNIHNIQEWENWVKTFGLNGRKVGIYPDDYQKIVNAKHFMRSIYFRLNSMSTGNNIQPFVLDVLSKITRS
ncbi:MAG: DUF2785 domain-containing protein [Anaerolineaceae bacterium]|nr:DUF2785 domain-containing protein [Anaerolineaceae bacterium]